MLTSSLGYGLSFLSLCPLTFLANIISILHSHFELSALVKKCPLIVSIVRLVAAILLQTMSPLIVLSVFMCDALSVIFCPNSLLLMTKLSLIVSERNSAPKKKKLWLKSFVFANNNVSLTNVKRKWFVVRSLL